MSAAPSPDAPTPAAPGARRAWASPAAQSVALQALGSACTLGAAVWVSWRFGLAAQGEFGLAKSWFDAAAVAAALGLPQGLLHLQYRRQVGSDSLWPWVRRWLLGAALLSMMAAVVAWLAGAHLAAWVMASVPLAAGHLLARSLLLPSHGTVVFGFVTALPSLLVFAGVLAMGVLDRGTGFAALLLVVACLSGATSLRWATRGLGPGPAAWPRGELWRVSLQSWLQAALGGALAAGLLSVVAASGQGGAALGLASLALQVYQVFAVLAGYAAPLLFDRLARQDMPSLQHHQLPALWRAALAGAVLAALAGAALSVAGHAPSWLLPAGLMLPAGLAAVAARVHGTVLLARGEYRELSLQGAWRLALALGLAALALRALPAAAAVALALLVTELLTWWRSARQARRPGSGAPVGPVEPALPPAALDG